jgi:hypothetical protein
MLSFIDGELSFTPSSSWLPELQSLDGIREVARFIRSYHEAVVDFVPPEPAIWSVGERGLFPGEIVCHGDNDGHQTSPLLNVG